MAGCSGVPRPNGVLAGRATEVEENFCTLL
jgi:hypothetical protein